MEQKDRRFAVLIDADNVSPKYIRYILDEISDQGVATYKRIYGDWTDVSKRSWKEQLLRYSINPIQQYSNTNGKNSTDSAMIIDAMDILYSGNVEGFCLVSSDSDFTKLAQRLRESGMYVLGMGEQKTPSSFRVACDAFKILEIISQNEDDVSPAATVVSETSARYGTAAEEAPAITSKVEIEKAVSRVLTENNDHGKNTTLSEMGNILQKKFSEFDVRNYGYSKLSTFLESMNDFEVLKIGHNYLVREKHVAVSRQQIEKYITELILANKGHIDNLSIIHDALRTHFPGFDVKQYGYSRISSFINSFKKFRITNNTVQLKQQSVEKTQS
ncbi:MAG: NYN domain-containing protein [Lachnospiraceae bacterium]|nr:NYN domain-containing protein [Lachnospiraceae bacterium]